MTIHLKLLSSHDGLQCPFCWYIENNYRKLKQFKTQVGLSVHIKASHTVTSEEYLENKLNIKSWKGSTEKSYLKFLARTGALK